MNKYINDFILDFEERMSRSYYDNLLYFKPIIPNPLLNFNNVLLLKQGQKYIHHTENVFQKSISKLICNLLKENGISATICKTDGGNGRGISVKSENIIIHFLGQEKFVNFPRVSWFEGLKNSLTKDMYVVNIKNDNNGVEFIKEANELLLEKGIDTKRFVLFECFCQDYFGNTITKELLDAFKQIEQELKEYKWIGLTPYFNSLTRDAFVNEIKEYIISIDYKKMALKYDSKMQEKDLKIIDENFKKNSFITLFSDSDFSGSFITSEWLYRNFQNDSSLEKTYIVTGYLKSIEQILVYLIKNHTLPGDTIGINSSSGLVEVDISSNDFYKATLGNLEHYLNDYSNRNIYNSKLAFNSIRTINVLIKDWIKNERNGYFHKHNIESFDKVSEIREKTLLLYYFLLGSLE